ncbi:AAA family ATPase [Bradyrhizobium sp. CCBAU 11357]|uniref:AAA family ATPase n=1 Tax=Bradyrhizobium sp. CCBAU 11357 TaxID=1630808 RepID=UPI002302D599|nr:AAA family ATPase [Bradyrhizobium sp. CCBAU 11357]MDA9498439.1 hypothetical protein [Bradyrhizobium sp. CCBAU 11357]
MTSATKKTRHPDDLRQSHNLSIGLRLINAGIPVFVSLNKASRIKRWQRLDTELPRSELEKVRNEYIAEGKAPLSIVGSTLDPKKWERMHRIAHRDGTASICCGLSKIVVIDADNKDRDGPALLAAYLDQHGGTPDGTVILTSQSGAKHYVFRDREGKYRNSEGEINRRLGCNVRGVAGQIVAPGSWRADGKRYGTPDDLRRFIEAITQDTLPELPQCLADLIGEASSEVVSDSDPRVKAGIAELKDEWPSFEEVFGNGQPLDLERLKSGSDKFRSLMEDPRSDRSSNRLSAASALKGASSRATVRDFAALCAEYPEIFGELVDKAEGSGTYDHRNLAKDFVTATAANMPLSDGSAFGNVAEAEREEAKAASAVLIEHLESAIVSADLDGNTALVEALEAELEKAKKASSTTNNIASEAHWYDNTISIPADLDINKLPPRPYLYAKYLMRGHVTLLSAAGGVGKSAWTLDAAIDLACGVDHLGAGEFKSRKVLVYNGEDDKDEMLRRVGAQFLHHEFSAELRAMVRENLTIISGVESSMRLAEYKDGRVMLKEKAFDKLAEIIESRAIDVVILDPLVALHSIPENANSEMNVIMTRFKSLAARRSVALMIAHHDKKNVGSKSLEDASQDDSRGAGTITTPTRVVLSMRRLTRKDAQAWNVPPEDVPHVIALSAGSKSNYSARDVVPRLFRAHSVQADNGTDEFAPDSTVALAVYMPPKREGANDGVGDEATLAVLAALDGDEPVGVDSRHGRWLGRLLADAVGWDASQKHVRDSVKVIIDDWKRRGWITEAVLEGGGKGAERRKSVKVFKRGTSRPAPRTFDFGPVDDESEEG